MGVRGAESSRTRVEVGGAGDPQTGGGGHGVRAVRGRARNRRAAVVPRHGRRPAEDVLAGLDPDAMSVSTKAGGVVFGLYFVFCGVIALLVAVRDRPAAGLGKILLISVAVVHGLLGALTVGLVGWGAFAFMMAVLGLVLLTLMTYDRQDGVADAAPGGSGDAGGPGGPEQAAPAVPPAPSAS